MSPWKDGGLTQRALLGPAPRSCPLASANRVPASPPASALPSLSPREIAGAGHWWVAWTGSPDLAPAFSLVGKPAMGDGWRGWGTDGVGLAEGRSPSARGRGLSMGRAVGWSWRGGEDRLALRCSRLLESQFWSLGYHLGRMGWICDTSRLGEPANLGRTLFDHGAGPHLCGVFRGRVGDWLRFAPGFRPAAECLPGFHEKGPSAEAEGPETRTKEGGSPRGNLRTSSSARRRPDRSPCRTRRWRCFCRSRCRRSNPRGSGSRRGSTRGRRRTPRTSG